jgi:biotin--protein ligase
METATLLAIGGGYDLGYIRALKTDGLHNIKTYVERGGSYLGICAGAYLVCRRIEFDKGGKLEICQPRDLGFFPGMSKMFSSQFICSKWGLD